jgi:formylglycine-generating enzyme required for sulfatase activity
MRLKKPWTLALEAAWVRNKNFQISPAALKKGRAGTPSFRLREVNLQLLLMKQGTLPKQVVIRSGWKLQGALSWRSPGFEQGDRHPMVCVDWNDAMAFVTWLAQKSGRRYRLLSESERETAS